MFTRFFLCGSNSNSNKDLTITLQKREREREREMDFDTSYHHVSLEDGNNKQNLLVIIKQKIQHYIPLNSNELDFIKEMDREDLYHIVWLYNLNNAKY